MIDNEVLVPLASSPKVRHRAWIISLIFKAETLSLKSDTRSELKIGFQLTKHEPEPRYMSFQRSRAHTTELEASSPVLGCRAAATNHRWVRPPVDHSIDVAQSPCGPREPEDHPLFTRRLISPQHVSPPLGGIDPWWRNRLLKPRAVADPDSPEI